MAELERELGLALREQQVKLSSVGTPSSQVLARSRHHKTRFGVEDAAKLPVADQKSCKMLLDIAQFRVLRSGSGGRLRWWKREA